MIIIIAHIYWVLTLMELSFIIHYPHFTGEETQV